MALSKKSWLAEGFALLAEFSQDKLTIQYLCTRLKVTRGSFYHHFSGIENYIQEMMEAWEEENTHLLVKEANTGSSAEESMELLAKAVSSKNQSIEAAIRSWSFYQPTVARHLAKVDQLRLTYLKQLHLKMGRSDEQANLIADLDYATLIGVQQLYPNIADEKMKALWQLQKKMITGL